MPTISNSDVFYLSRAKYIEDEFKNGNRKTAYKECDEMLQDSRLPFYYRGHFHLILSNNDRDPVWHAMQGLAAFDQMMWQSPKDLEVARYILYAQRVLVRVQREVAQEDLEKKDVVDTASVSTIADAQKNVAEEHSTKQMAISFHTAEAQKIARVRAWEEAVVEDRNFEDLIASEFRNLRIDRKQCPFTREISRLYADI